MLTKRVYELTAAGWARTAAGVQSPAKRLHAGALGVDVLWSTVCMMVQFATMTALRKPSEFSKKFGAHRAPLQQTSLLLCVRIPIMKRALILTICLGLISLNDAKGAERRGSL